MPPRAMPTAAVAVALACAVAATATAAAATVPQPQTLPRPQSDLMAAASADGTPVVFLQHETDTLDSTGVAWHSIQGGAGVITAAAATVSSGSIIVVGGGAQEGLANTTIFDVTTGSLSTGAPMPSPRGFLGAAAVGNTLYAVGGYAAKGWDIVESYDVTADKWSTGLAAMPTGRYGLCATSAHGQVIAIGGSAYKVPASSEVDAYDPKMDRWNPIASLQTARAYFACTTVTSGTSQVVYAFGGVDGDGKKLTSVEYLDMADSSAVWKSGADMASPARAHFAAVAVQGGAAVLLLGGAVGNSFNEHPIDTVEVFPVATAA